MCNMNHSENKQESNQITGLQNDRILSLKFFHTWLAKNFISMDLGHMNNVLDQYEPLACPKFRQVVCEVRH